MRPCDRDNVYKFNIDGGKLVIDESADVCQNTSQERNLDLTLESTTNPESFIVGPGDVNVGNYTHEILSWTDNTQFVTRVTGSFGGINFTIDYTFKAQ